MLLILETQVSIKLAPGLRNRTISNDIMQKPVKNRRKKLNNQITLAELGTLNRRPWSAWCVPVD
jgi:hypothetical protein